MNDKEDSSCNEKNDLFLLFGIVMAFGSVDEIDLESLGNMNAKIYRYRIFV